MTNRLSLAHSIVRDTFSRKIRAATEERDRLTALLTRCGADTLSVSDLEVLAADGNGFANFLEARVSARGGVP